MATCTIKRLQTSSDIVSDHYTDGNPDGVFVYCFRYGNVVTVSCGTGTFKDEFSARATFATLPEQYRPSALISTTDFGTNGSRVRIKTDGSVETWSAKQVGYNVLFCATYVVND